MKTLKLAIFSLLLLTFTGCGVASRVVNPLYEAPTDLALKGEASDNALNSGGLKEDTARKALEQMASYQRANTPSPDRPVMQPAVVRLMWIPDHLNSHGDLVPSHYYYLKVLKERWAVTDAFELEGQLKQGGSSSSTPFVYEGDLRKK